MGIEVLVVVYNCILLLQGYIHKKFICFYLFKKFEGVTCISSFTFCITRFFIKKKKKKYHNHVILNKNLIYKFS